jgi:hypothetical protein
MNLLVKKFWPLAFVLLAAVFAISCEDPGKIGLIINEENGIISTYYKEMVVPTSVVQLNPRKTSESVTLQVGSYISNDFGAITSKSYSQLTPSIFVQPNANAVYVGFEMTVGFQLVTGPDPQNSELQTVSIYQLAEEIDTTKTYLRTDELGLGSKLADWEFAPIINDTLQTDSVYTLALSNTIGVDLFNKLRDGDPIFQNSRLFNEYFKGIAFIPTATSKNIFLLDRTKIRITLKYNEFNSDGAPIERTYTINGSSNSFFYLDSDKSGTALSGIAADNTSFYPANGYRYLQYGTLMALRADLTPFYDLTDTLNNVIINKAEIVIAPIGPYTEYDAPPSFLQVYFTNDDNDWPIVDNVGRYDSSTVGENFIMLQEDGAGVLPGAYGFPQSTFFNEDDNSYRIDISLFFQNLYSGNFTSVEQPFLEEQAQVFIFGETDVLLPQRTTTQVLTNNLVVHSDSIRLKIHYSVPNTNQP